MFTVAGHFLINVIPELNDEKKVSLDTFFILKIIDVTNQIKH